MKSFRKNKKITQNLRENTAILQHCRSATLIAMLPALLSGCMGIYEGGFECPAGTGVGCRSISEVNDMVNQGVLPPSYPISTSQEMGNDFDGNTLKCESSNKSFSSTQEKREIWINPLYLKSIPLRAQAKSEEKKENFIEAPHKHIKEEIQQEKGQNDTIFL